MAATSYGAPVWRGMLTALLSPLHTDTLLQWLCDARALLWSGYHPAKLVDDEYDPLEIRLPLPGLHYMDRVSVSPSIWSNSDVAKYD